MTNNFLSTLTSSSVLEQQRAYYGKTLPVPAATTADEVGPDEAAFIGERDSFYMASVSPDGWPYLQHRGGPVGFLKVLDSRTLAFADFSGNRQLLSTGNLAANDRVALFLMDYRTRTRLKILGHAQIMPAAADAALTAAITPQGIAARKVERLYRIQVIGLNWNCSQHITPRFTVAEIEAATAPLHERIASLERELKQARSGPAN